MYFPYLRGRQNELLAIFELLSANRISKMIIPIIEPVKMSPTLIKTLELFRDNNHQICLIMNPEVGNFVNEVTNASEKELEKKYREKIFDLIYDKKITKAYIWNKGAIRIINNLITKQPAYTIEDLIVILNSREYLQLYTDKFDKKNPLYTITPDESSFRRRAKGQKVVLTNSFVKAEKNADYSATPDEEFSEEYLYFSNDGYDGFSDYSIIGSDYDEGGFAPRAVAIHVVYETKTGLRIKHFVSDSNDDIQDTAKKFYEALSKFHKWFEDENPPLTLGIERLLDHFTNKTYPGLGVLKKLTIMHHIELIDQILNRKEPS